MHLILEQQVSLASPQAAFDRLGAAIATVTPTRSDAGRRGAPRDRVQQAEDGLRARPRHGDARRFAARVAGGASRRRGARCADRAPRIGRWTADIYLTMCLLRDDEWPTATSRSRRRPEIGAHPPAGTFPTRSSRSSRNAGTRTEPSRRASSGSTTSASATAPLDVLSSRSRRCCATRPRAVALAGQKSADGRPLVEHKRHERRRARSSRGSPSVRTTRVRLGRGAGGDATGSQDGVRDIEHVDGDQQLRAAGPASVDSASQVDSHSVATTPIASTGSATSIANSLSTDRADSRHLHEPRPIAVSLAPRDAARLNTIGSRVHQGFATPMQQPAAFAGSKDRASTAVATRWPTCIAARHPIIGADRRPLAADDASRGLRGVLLPRTIRGRRELRGRSAGRPAMPATWHDVSMLDAPAT